MNLLDRPPLFWGILIGGLVGLLSCMLLGLILGQLSPPTPDQELAIAQSRWATRPFGHYRMVVQDDNGKCSQDAIVQDEQIVKNLQNDCRIPTRTVTSLFNLIKSSMPYRYRCIEYGCACDTVMSVRIVYDSQLGYPREIGFRWAVEANWRHLDFWKVVLTTGKSPSCRTTVFNRTTTVLSLTPMP